MLMSRTHILYAILQFLFFNKVLCKVRKEWQRMAMAKVQSAEELRVFRET